jgi:hypothetical protein
MSRLESIAAQIEGDSQPPVHLWNPAHVGEIDIEIDHLGRWFHEGGQIKRPALVRLFASILWRENGEYFLVTPAEKLKIRVADVPLTVELAEWIDGSWVVTTNTVQRVIISEQHPVKLQTYRGQLVPYVNVRYDLWARVSRAVFFQWVEIALDDTTDDPVILKSGDYTAALA